MPNPTKGIHTTGAKKAQSGRLTAEEVEEILDLIPDRLKPGVLDGSLAVKPQSMWYSEDKPVIVGAHDNHIKHGRYITANNPGTISKQTAYKRRRGYREMQQIYIGAEPGEHEKQIISLKEIIDALWEAANGSPQLVKCPHPELHPPGSRIPLEHVVAFKKDPNALFKLYENTVGKATETTEVNVNQTTLVKLLQDRTPLTELTVIDLPPDQIYARRKLIEAADLEDDSE